MDYSKYERIRPLIPSEVPAAIEELLANPELRAAYESLGPALPWEQLSHILKDCHSVADFKTAFSAGLVRHIMKLTCRSVAPLQGTEVLKPECAYTYISNHRDIILDSAFLNVLIYDAGFQYPEIAIGDNLLVRPWVEKLVKLNGNFLVRRNLQGREVLLAAKELSNYMNDAILDGIPLWIAQREGRAKNSDDRTQPALLKMLSLGGSTRSFVDNLRSLNIVPLTCSYEYDPCDYLKAQEMQCKRDIEGFKKSPQDDAINMRTGVTGYKGRVTFTIGKPLNSLLDNYDWVSIPASEQPERVAEIMDKEIHRNYTLYPSNYVALDMLKGSSDNSKYYTAEEQAEFVKYLDGQLNKILLPEGVQRDEDYLKARILEMYANPVINHQKALAH